MLIYGYILLTFDFIERPPESYTTPLPTQAIDSPLLGTTWLKTTKAGGWTAAWPTE